jgi:hypothetical protein
MPGYQCKSPQALWAPCNLDNAMSAVVTLASSRHIVCLARTALISCHLEPERTAMPCRLQLHRLAQLLARSRHGDAR